MSKCKYSCRDDYCRIDCKDIALRNVIIQKVSITDKYSNALHILDYVSTSICDYMDKYKFTKEVAQKYKNIWTLYMDFCSNPSFRDLTFNVSTGRLKIKKGEKETISEDLYELISNIERYSNKKIVKTYEKQNENKVLIEWLVGYDELVYIISDILKNLLQGEVPNDLGRILFCKELRVNAGHAYYFDIDIEELCYRDISFKKCRLYWQDYSLLIECNVDLSFTLSPYFKQQSVAEYVKKILNDVAKCLSEYFETRHPCAIPFSYLCDIPVMPLAIPHFKIYYEPLERIFNKYNQGHILKPINMAFKSSDEPNKFRYIERIMIGPPVLVFFGSGASHFVLPTFHRESLDLSWDIYDDPYPDPIYSNLLGTFVPAYFNLIPGVFIKDSMFDILGKYMEIISEELMEEEQVRSFLSFISDSILTPDTVFTFTNRLLSF